MENNNSSEKIINKTSPSMLPEHLQKYMPSKKIQIIIVVLLGIMLLYAFKTPLISLFNRITNRATPLPTPALSTETNPELTALSIDVDTDGDGLADWQETLLGTDPTVPNSKSDVPDSVRQLVAISSNNLVTVEDKIALRVYERVKSDPVGDNLSEAFQAATTKELLDLANSIDIQLTNYTYDDLDLIDDTFETRATYKNSIVAFNKTLSVNEKTTQEIYEGIMTGKKTVGISTFQVSLKQHVTKLLSMPVPLKLADLHLTMINALAHENDILTKNSALQSADSILYASLLVFQKNVNLLKETVDVILTVI